MFGMNSWKVVVIAAIGLVTIGMSAYGGSVPQVINYQGTLKQNGNPANGSVNVMFSVYSTATGGTPLWTENWSSTATPANPVIVSNGNFNVMLGALTPFSPTFFSDHQKTYLGTKVGTDSEMLPRQQFASVGYSFAAGNGIPKGGIIMWSGAVNQIPDGWVLCDGTNGTPNLRDRFVVGAGDGYAVGAIGGNASVNIQHIHTGKTGVNSSYSDRSKTNDLMKVAENTHYHNFTTDLGGSTALDVRPPYYALAFIMKL